MKQTQSHEAFIAANGESEVVATKVRARSTLYQLANGDRYELDAHEVDMLGRAVLAGRFTMRLGRDMRGRLGE